MAEKMCENSCAAFSEALASSAPVPGGGGASAYVGALSAALGQMVGALTVGKKKYAEVEAEVKDISQKLDALRLELLSLVDADAEGFLPLSKAYGLPKDTPEQSTERESVMEAALRTACEAPISMMRRCAEIIELQALLCEKGSALAKSDVGVGVCCASAALRGASLNIFINAMSMTDRQYADALTSQAEELLNKYVPMAEEVFSSVLGKIR